MASYSHDFPFGIMDVVELLHLKVRRRQANSAYVDCPFCNDYRGKMNVNYAKDAWRCNYCGESGGMLSLYARMNNTTTSDAYREICDALQTGDTYWGASGSTSAEAVRTGGSDESPRSAESGPCGKYDLQIVDQSNLASPQEVHQTLSLLFGMLSLRQTHKEHLMSRKRGLTQEQIKQYGFKSTPPHFICRSLTERLIKNGCTVRGVPGFYQDKNGNWTVNFNSFTSGILIPAVGADGMIHGAQILLDKPMKNETDPPDKPGAKYIWFSSSSKNMGTGSGSPLLFLGDLSANTVYITEGLLKGYISHSLMNRTIAATAGANNTAAFDELFRLLAKNGTKLIVEAQDMDKYANENTAKGASKIYLLARKYGMQCRRLTWNPNYKGLDDWQLALKYGDQPKRKEMTFKELYLWGQCGIDAIDKHLETASAHGIPNENVRGYLGLSEKEMSVFSYGGSDELKNILNIQRRPQRFRIYQLDFAKGTQTIPFEFKGYEEMRKAGFLQPPAGKYRLVYEGAVFCPCNAPHEEILGNIRIGFSERMPEGFSGRAVAPSDVLELYAEDYRRYFYVDMNGFRQVRFSPFLTKTGKEHMET